MQKKGDQFLFTQRSYYPPQQAREVRYVTKKMATESRSRTLRR